MVSLVGDVVSLREEPRPKNYGRSVSFSCRNVGVAAGGKLMNVTEVLRRIFSQPQSNDESMVTPERLNFVLQQLSEYRNEIMSSPDYHAGFAPSKSDMLKEPKVLWAYELVTSLTNKIEFITELLKTPGQISEQRLERVLRALFWHYDAIVPDNKLDDTRYYELLDSLNNRIQVVTLLLQIPRSRITEVLMIITYYHAGIKNIASSFYPIVHKWINKSEGTLKTLPLPPDVLFRGQKQSFEMQSGNWLAIDGSRKQSSVMQTGSLSAIDGVVDGSA